MKRMGVFGGTFNPIHNGHIVIAEEVLKALKLDTIIFVPANIPPHKSSAGIAKAKDRFNMVKLATEYNNNFGVSDLEIKRLGPSYTIDTIKEFKNKFEDNDQFYFIIGSDTIPELKKWKDINHLLKIIKFVVVNRPRHSFKGIPRGTLRIQIRGIGISSSKIRKCLIEKRTIHSLVPESVERYIIKKGLYKNAK
ncbi:MAG: nicotinate-nucleotide adenylyltransferase [Candidatus Omnitrophota bacterium]